ncbi:MAG: hypothetical protein IT378_25420 [Sandaracinaceae bacterium]|nr:hypothetical protein [Sandaracinaceae bacterium]
MRALLLVAVLASTLPASAQGATDTQRALVTRFAELRALGVRYGDAHPDVVAKRAAVESLRRSLREAIARGEPIDVPAARRDVEAMVADVDARIAELNITCGAGHFDVRTARARREALVEALSALRRGRPFVPDA